MKNAKNDKMKRLWIALLAAGLVGTTPAVAQVNEDEWLDPTDWFDGNNIETDDTYDYDYDAYDYDYDYGFDGIYDYGDNWTSYDTWGDDEWDADYYDAGYWDDYDWYENDEVIEEDFDDTYDFAIYGENDSNQSNQSNSSNNQKQTQVASLSGTIEGLTNLRLKRQSGATSTYTLAKVKLDSGKSTVVNLGRESQLQDVNLKEGDNIKALGRRGTVAGQTVFVAHKLKANGETIDANPVIRLNRSQTQQASNSSDSGSSSSQSASSQPMIQGTVANISETQIDSAPEGHTFVQIKLQDGSTRVVDLGPAASVEKINLDQGDRVTVRGETKQMGDQQVLVPNLMKIDGERVTSVTE